MCSFLSRALFFTLLPRFVLGCPCVRLRGRQHLRLLCRICGCPLKKKADPDCSKSALALARGGGAVSVRRSAPPQRLGGLGFGAWAPDTRLPGFWAAANCARCGWRLRACWLRCCCCMPRDLSVPLYPVRAYACAAAYTITAPIYLSRACQGASLLTRRAWRKSPVGASRLRFGGGASAPRVYGVPPCCRYGDGCGFSFLLSS